MSGPTLFTCASCGRKNRAPEGKPLEAARCGVCKTPLFADHPADVDEATFKRIAGGDDLPVVVDVWAPWCGPCRTMAPAFAQAADTLKGQIRFIKINADTAPGLMQAYGIQGIPTMLMFKGGKLANRVSGALPAGQIVTWAQQAG
ncbi:thioredoxin TrxC [Zhengella mangrovi]|uniref:Thioredoxin TrxC n=1 Tax=Zhengella mangrovi TaxID=1982044 RepID=A0A2G1QIE7_9HYPH|nr:thioredoxin TrxC [Zhengella mangrovi]PHP65317.1 thioredoxin TrxC [Zhengella mangrovi]